MKNFIGLSLILVMALTSKAQTGAADEKQAETMLRTFYTAYMSAFSDTSRNFEETLKGLRSKYCTLKCRKQYAKLVDLTDGDPIINAQDSGAEFVKTLVISKKPQGANLYRVAYNSPAYDKNGKERLETITINLAVIAQNGTLKIDAILQ